jgi:hypothetical protein
MVDGKKDMKKYLPKEESIQEVLCQYMNKYPDVWFRCDLAGLCLPIGQAVKVKKCTYDNGFPDFFIPTRTKNYSGLFIEIKKSYDEVYTKKGVIRNTKHIREQLRCLEYLEGQGFKAIFGLGLDHCMKIVEEYLEEYLNG